jgi:hypothetical protein
MALPVLSSPATMTSSHDRTALSTRAIAAAMLVAIACAAPPQGQPGTGGVQGGGGNPSGFGGAPNGSGGMNGGGAGGSRALGTGGVGMGGGPGTGGGLGTGGGGPGTGGSAGAGSGGTGSGGRGGAGGGGAGGHAPTAGSPCESNADCGSNVGALTCRAPGEFLGCGNCIQGPSSCSSDTDCASISDGGVAVAHRICAIAPSADCYCSSVKICQIGCSSQADCITGQGCNASHQCQSSCTPGDGTCPTDYSCSASGFCTQNSCTDDSQCSGACVKGSCYVTPGTCAVRPA